MRIGMLPALLLPCLAVMPRPALSSNDIVIVPQGAAGYQIHDQDLLANDVRGATIVSFTPTSRGDLRRSESCLVYDPSPEFYAAGMDTFSYVLDPESGARALVFLVAEAAGEPSPATDMDLEIGAQGAVRLRHGSLGGASLSQEITLAEARLVAAGTEDGGYLKTLMATPALSWRGPSDSGGSIESELDPSGFTSPAGDWTTIARVTVDGKLNVEVNLGHDGNAPVLGARALRDDGQPIEVPPVSLDGSAIPLGDSPWPFAVRWWSASRPGAMDGGLSLELGKMVVASASGLDLLASPWPREVEVRVGAMETGGGSGSLRLVNPRHRRFISRPALTPIFADGVESGDTSVWTAALGSVNVTSAAAIRGDQGISIPASFPSFLIDDSPDGETHLRARFNLGTGNLTLAAGGGLTLLTGNDAGGGGIEPFAVEIRRAGGDLEVCAKAQTAPGQWQVTECPAPVGASSSIEVKWWAAAERQGRGGLTIRLDNPGQPPVTASLDDLDNHGQSIDEIRFGAVESIGVAAGELHLDDFESWR